MKIALAMVFAFSVSCSAQTVDAAQSSAAQVVGPQRRALPAPPPDPLSRVPEPFDFRVGYVCGAGATTSPVTTKPTLGCGVGITLFPLIFVEVGVMGPQANRSYLSGYISVDGSVPIGIRRKQFSAELIAGYSRLFETGHALDYGFAVNLPRTGKDATGGNLRIEVRDYWTFANPAQHNAMLRLGWIWGGPYWD